jgi:hypothetical protein
MVVGIELMYSTQVLVCIWKLIAKWLLLQPVRYRTQLVNFWRIVAQISNPLFAGDCYSPKGPWLRVPWHPNSKDPKLQSTKGCEQSDVPARQQPCPRASGEIPSRTQQCQEQRDNSPLQLHPISWPPADLAYKLMKTNIKFDVLRCRCDGTSQNKQCRVTCSFSNHNP